MKLTERQRRMLEAGTFHIDGWNGSDALDDAMHLQRAGFLTSFVTQTSQYTAVNYTVTDAGRAALKAKE